jgi:regulator of cell morphogenesis and NO signaling
MQTTINPGTQVGQLVAERPSRARIFEQHKIDYCCGGKLPLEDICNRKGLDVQSIIEEIEKLDQGGTEEVRNYKEMPLGELCDHIVRTHHDYLRAELPRIEGLAEKVARVHGENYPEAVEIYNVFHGLHAELSSHTMKEEQILFPWIKRIEAGSAGPFPGAAVASPISCMEAEHDDAGEALEKLSNLTDGYTAPMHACNTWRVLYDSLRVLELDMHTHIHKENNILFPRTLKAVGV